MTLYIISRDTALSSVRKLQILDNFSFRYTILASPPRFTLAAVSLAGRTMFENPI